MTVEERNALVEQHLDLVRRMARAIARHLGPRFDVDDLEQAGTIGLIHGADTYDAAKGDFEPWAKHKIRWAIRASLWFRRDEALPADPPAPDAGPSMETKLDVRRGIATLPRRQQHVVIEFDMKERTMRSIALELGVDVSRVSQLRRAALDNLRDKLAA